MGQEKREGGKRRGREGGEGGRERGRNRVYKVGSAVLHPNHVKFPVQCNKTHT